MPRRARAAPRNRGRSAKKEKNPFFLFARASSSRLASSLRTGLEHIHIHIHIHIRIRIRMRVRARAPGGATRAARSPPPPRPRSRSLTPHSHTLSHSRPASEYFSLSISASSVSQASLRASQVDRSRPRSVGFAPACLRSLDRRLAGRSVGPVRSQGNGGKKIAAAGRNSRRAARVWRTARARAATRPRAASRARLAAASEPAGHRRAEAPCQARAADGRRVSPSPPRRTIEGDGCACRWRDAAARPDRPRASASYVASERLLLQARAFFVSVPASGFLGEKKRGKENLKELRQLRRPARVRTRALGGRGAGGPQRVRGRARRAGAPF